MSARQPFTPFRPVSRAASAQQASNISTDTRADPSFGDNALCPPPPPGQSVGKDTSQAPQMMHTESTNQHFNLSGLMPSTDKTLQALRLRKAKTADGFPQFPCVNQQTIQIATPSTTSPNFTPSATGHITVTTFGDHPRLPVSEHTLARSSYDSAASNDAYSARSPDVSEPYSRQNAFKTRMHSSRSLEKITETSEEDDSEEHTGHQERGFEFNSASEKNLSVEVDPRFQDFETTYFTQDYAVSDDISRGRALRRTSKKRPQQPDEDEDYGLIGVGKRFKSDEDQVCFLHLFRILPMVTQFSQHATPVMPMHRSNHLASTHRSQAVGTYHEESILHRIIGPDVDIRAEKKIEDYERARRRWVECSLEEWENGAQGEFK
jgi:hypothetical protein